MMGEAHGAHHGGVPLVEEAHGDVQMSTMRSCPQCLQQGHACGAHSGERHKMERCQYRELFVVSTVGNADSEEMMVVLMIKRRPQWGGAHSALEGRCPHWGHGQGACNREVLVMLTKGRYPLVMPLMGRCS